MYRVFNLIINDREEMRERGMIIMIMIRRERESNTNLPARDKNKMAVHK